MQQIHVVHQIHLNKHSHPDDAVATENMTVIDAKKAIGITGKGSTKNFSTELRHSKNIRGQRW